MKTFGLLMALMVILTGSAFAECNCDEEDCTSDCCTCAVEDCDSAEECECECTCEGTQEDCTGDCCTCAAEDCDSECNCEGNCTCHEEEVIEETPEETHNCSGCPGGCH